MRRYFLIHYQAVTSENHIYMGMVSIVMEDGSYINRKHTEETIKRSASDGGSGVNLDEGRVVIGNIIELNESDYLDWYE